MSRLRAGIVSVWRNVMQRGRVEADLDAELKSYVQLLVDEKMRGGMSETAARRSAALELGGTERVKEEVRDVKRGFGLDAFVQDVRYGIRNLVKTPGLTALTLFSLAIGIGINASLFSLVDRLVLSTLPVRDPDGLYILFSNNRTGLTDDFSYPDFELIRSSFEAFDGVLARTEREYTFEIDNRAVPIRAEVVTGSYFNVLGLRPAMGRLIEPTDDQPASEFAVVLGHQFWQTALRRDPNVIGRTARIRLAGQSEGTRVAELRVIGVAPREFSGAAIGDSPHLFLPMHALTAINQRALQATNGFCCQIMARLKPGVTEEQARAELSNRIPNFDSGARTRKPGVVPLDGHARKLRLRAGKYGYSAVRDEYAYSLLLLMTLVAVVLVIACANLANLLLVRAMARVREIGARLALGATPARLVRQWLTESLLLSGIGGLCGIAIAFWTTRLLLMFIPERDRAYLSFELGARNLAFTALITLATGLLFGVLPAIRVSRVPLNALLTRATGAAISGRKGRLTRVVVVAQIAVSLFMVSGAGLFVRTLSRLNAETGGFDRRAVVYGEVPGLPRQPPGRAGAMLAQIVERLNSAPGIANASLVSSLPMTFMPGWAPAVVPGYAPRDDEATTVFINFSAPGYFRTMGIAIIAGRDFEEGDRTEKSTKAIVNQRFAERFFKGRNPIGETFRVGTNRDLLLVGVVQDTNLTSFREGDRDIVYYPLPLTYRGTLVARARPGFTAAAAASAIRTAVAAVDNNLEVKTGEMEELVQETLARDRLVAQLSAGLGVLALVLASVGLYGVMAYAVSARTAEIGVRMATGAQRSHIVRMVLKETLGIAALGVAIGLPLSLAANRLLEAQLFGVSPSDPVALTFAIALMLAVALLAGYVPARRAARLDPVRALRGD